MIAPEPAPQPNASADVAPSGEAASIAASNVPAPAPAKQLSPEEQMALFEKELKENDWGHQPC